jgi:3-phosphoshikimate 1-carboxyvinyltransferase
LNKLGADVQIIGDSMVIHGVKQLHGGEVDTFGDHRIAMMAAVASIKSSSQVQINDYSCVKKSYPGFWRDFEIAPRRI